LAAFFICVGAYINAVFRHFRIKGTIQEIDKVFKSQADRIKTNTCLKICA